MGLSQHHHLALLTPPLPKSAEAQCSLLSSRSTTREQRLISGNKSHHTFSWGASPARWWWRRAPKDKNTQTQSLPLRKALCVCFIVFFAWRFFSFCCLHVCCHCFTITAAALVCDLPDGAGFLSLSYQQNKTKKSHKLFRGVKSNVNKLTTSQWG